MTNRLPSRLAKDSHSQHASAAAGTSVWTVFVNLISNGGTVAIDVGTGEVAGVEQRHQRRFGSA